MASSRKTPKPNRAFTIINRNREVNAKRAEFEDDLVHGLKRRAPRTFEAFERLSTPLKEVALATTAPKGPIDWVRSPRQVIPEQAQLIGAFADAVRAVETHAGATTIGIVDLGARVAGLTALVDRMNAAQDRFAFIEVQTPVPAGMIKTGSALIEAFERAYGSRLPPRVRDDVDRNMLVSDFLTFAESVRTGFGLDRLVGITPAMLAFVMDDQPLWNFFSYGDKGPNSLVSTYDLREYAAAAGRPFEAAVGMLVMGQGVLVQGGLPFHHENRGCPLDYNQQRSGLVDSIRGMRLDKDCETAMRQRDVEEAEAAVALLAALRRMRKS